MISIIISTLDQVAAEKVGRLAVLSSGFNLNKQTCFVTQPSRIILVKKIIILYILHRINLTSFQEGTLVLLPTNLFILMVPKNVPIANNSGYLNALSLIWTFVDQIANRDYFITKRKIRLN